MHQSQLCGACNQKKHRALHGFGRDEELDLLDPTVCGFDLLGSSGSDVQRQDRVSFVRNSD